MTLDRTAQRPMCLAATVLCALVGLGCGNDDAATREGANDSGGTGGVSFDGAGGAPTTGAGGEGGASGLEGGPPAADLGAGAFVSNPVDQLFADPEATASDILGQDALGSGAYVEAAATCYAEVSGCSAPGCEAFASCCVATGNCCAPVSDAGVDFVQCSGLSLDACAGDEGLTAEVFGSLFPALTERGLVPNGTATTEGGVLVGEAVSLSSNRFEVDVQFARPIGCGGSCLESAGVALTPATALDTFGGAEVGLLLSGSRGLVHLLIRDQVADSFDAGDDDTRWSLVVSPEGVAEVLRDGVVVGVYPFDTSTIEWARLAVFGRNLGPLADSATVTRVSVRTAVCDAPTAWTERIPMLVTLEDQLNPAFMTGREPSFAEGPAYTAIAFERDGGIFVGEERGITEFDVASADPFITPSEAFEAGGVADPELFWISDTLHIYYTAYDERGAGSIGAAVVVDGVPQRQPSPVLLADDDAVALEDPTVVFRDGLSILVVRATLQSGATELRAYYAPDIDAGWARIVDGTLEQLTRVEDPTSELRSPSLIIHNGAYQLYVARRAGTRWSVELLMSEELLLWRPLGEVLGPSGDGFDSLGARGADARSIGDRVDVVYMGQDGVSFQLGYATRAAPTGTAR